MNHIFIGSGIGIGLGLGLSMVVSFWMRRQQLYELNQSAEDIIQTAKNNEELSRTRILDQMEHYKTQLLAQNEKAKEMFFKERRRLQSETDKFVHQQKKYFSRKEHDKNKKEEEIKKLNKLAHQQTRELHRVRVQIEEQKKSVVQNLQERFNIDIKTLKKNYCEKQVTDTKHNVIQWIRRNEEYFKQNLNKQAHSILELVLSRFQHPYCPERGIGNVVFASHNAIKSLFGRDMILIQQLERECGVDMKVHDKEPSIAVFGIDPVRRELGRAVLQKIAKKKQIRGADIKKTVHETKRELFRQIRNDGERICRVLGLRNVKTEVKNLMGALRYRYSFAQNQHFHCLEVAWLCGLLNAELGSVDEAEARRAGMLHDIGKAIDYSKEGGHAVIGADFIQQYGESPTIVQAVKAHHYDVTPENSLDFLVISADALSGARPGARRSTVDSYNQKMLTLEKIGQSFEGVKDSYVINAGREVRVIVDSQQVDDNQALKLSQQIAEQIEEKCSYPGLIKVTVVRTVVCNVSAYQNNNRTRSARA